METNTSANIVLELGGMNLLAYFQQKIGQNYIYKESIHEGIIKNMLKCAAVAIQQFHKHGIHLDIKPNNFVIPHGHNLNAPLEFCKLIDFNCSVLTKESKAKKSGKFGVIPYIPFEFTNKNDVFEVSREIDVYSFGVMIYKFMFSPHMIMVNIDIEKFGNGSLDRIAKACLQNDPKNRPSIQAIISFLEEKCHYFSCEDKEQYSEYQKLCED
uniref:Protein kinase domain-containing protein n=1 Tax=Meloidogyne floridensis TaxID=298350 RepID=A0A915NEG2_9BILA